ncbi:hypothetical protein D3C72_2451950 [compost metagenome]
MVARAVNHIDFEFLWNLAACCRLDRCIDIGYSQLAEFRIGVRLSYYCCYCFLNLLVCPTHDLNPPKIVCVFVAYNY